MDCAYTCTWAMMTREITLWHDCICAAADAVGHLRNRSHQICLMISCMWLGVQELQIQKPVLVFACAVYSVAHTVSFVHAPCHSGF